MHVCIPFNDTQFYDSTGGYFNSTIKFYPFGLVPRVTYNKLEDDEDHGPIYRICGPYILVLAILASKLNARLEMMTLIVDKIESLTLQSQSPPHLLIMPISAPAMDFVRNIYQSFGMDLIFTRSF